MIKLLCATILPCLLLAPALSIQAAETVRQLDVVSMPMHADTSQAGEQVASTMPTKPVSAFSPSPVLTRQSVSLKPDGSLEMRCDGGSRRNFAAIQRSSEFGRHQQAQQR